MNKVKVKLVKYDLTKTKNRNRKDMLVDHQSEAAVISQLERIHKGESVVKVHEIIWDEQQMMEADDEEWFTGIVKFFDLEKGFGFIVPDDEIEELFFHQSACVDGTPGDRQRVEFKISKGPKGLSAIYVRVIE